MNAYKQKPFFTFSFMDSLGTIVSFFSNKVKEKVDLIRELSLRASAKDYGKDHTPPQSVGQKNNVRVTENTPPPPHNQTAANCSKPLFSRITR